MALINQIKSVQLIARKASIATPAAPITPENINQQTARIDAALLTTLVAEAERVGKDAGNRAPSDEEVTTVIRKFIKNLDETLKVRPDDNKAAIERGLLESYLPAPLSDAELGALLGGAPAGLEMSLKNMKAITAYVNAIHPGRVTGQQLANALRARS